MICLEKMLNFDDFTSSIFFYFLIVKKHQFYRFFLKKCLNLGFLYIRNGNSTTTVERRDSDQNIQLLKLCKKWSSGKYGKICFKYGNFAPPTQ